MGRSETVNGKSWKLTTRKVGTFFCSSIGSAVEWSALKILKISHGLVIIATLWNRVFAYSFKKNVIFKSQTQSS